MVSHWSKYLTLHTGEFAIPALHTVTRFMCSLLLVCFVLRCICLFVCFHVSYTIRFIYISIFKHEVNELFICSNFISTFHKPKPCFAWFLLQASSSSIFMFWRFCVAFYVCLIPLKLCSASSVCRFASDWDKVIVSTCSSCICYIVYICYAFLFLAAIFSFFTTLSYLMLKYGCFPECTQHYTFAGLRVYSLEKCVKSYVCFFCCHFF